jgi:CHC2 zinc finger
VNSPLSPETIAQALACGEPGCSCGKRSGDGYMTHCPAHRDETPSFQVSEKNAKILVKCFGGCSQAAVIEALKEKGLWRLNDKGAITPGNPRNGGTVREKSEKTKGLTVPPPSGTPRNGGGTPPGLTLVELAEAKKLPIDFLKGMGLSYQKFKGQPRVIIPYMSEAGEVVATRYRLSLNGAQRFAWRKGDRVMLYGLWTLPDIRKAGWCLLEEGESDFWTARHYGLPAMGLPGASTWRPEWAEHFGGARVYLWVEPDGAGQALPTKIGKDLPALMVIQAPEGIKDLSQAHLQGQDVLALVEKLKAQAVPAADLVRAQQDSRVKELREEAQPVLAHPDPLEMICKQVETLGYGGDPAPVVIVYLAITSRLLAMRPGAMPVHLLLLAQASAGKSYTVKVVLLLMPPEAVHEIDAGSPRVLIYDEAELVHRAVIFGEADSLPAGEDNPAASAIRNLLQDHRLHYKVTEKDPESGGYRVREIEKPGPTVLITTSTRRLGHQLDTRLFTLEVPDEPARVRQALETQGAQELEEPSHPDQALISYQSYLQALAPWRVVVPFAPTLARKIGDSASAPRILRDFSRLLSLVKSVAILRHTHRQRDGQGRLIAQVEDYKTIFDLVAPMFEAATTGASEGVRLAVQAVTDLGNGSTVSDIARHLKIGKASASRRVKVAVKNGWLINQETVKGRQARLEVGEPMPERAGLPDPKVFHPAPTVPPGVPGGDKGQHTEFISNNCHCSTDPGLTESNTLPHQEDDLWSGMA